MVLQVPKGRVEGLRQTSGGSLRMIGNGTFTLARYTGITAMMERLMTYLPHAFLAATTLLIWASIVTSTLI